MPHNCSKGYLGEPFTKNDLVSFFINNTDKSISAFVNSKIIPIDDLLEVSMDDGKLLITIDIKSLELKHKLKDPQVSLLYKQE